MFNQIIKNILNLALYDLVENLLNGILTYIKNKRGQHDKTN